MSSLLITNDYPPITSGISTLFYNIWKHLPTDETMVLAPRTEKANLFDAKEKIRVFRYPSILSDHSWIKLINLLMLIPIAVFLILLKRIDKVHCGQILIPGITGLLLKKVFNISYYLWCYGGETTSVYRSKRTMRYWVDSIIKNAEQIIVVSEYIAEELRSFGVLDKKIVKVLPAIDHDSFRPKDKQGRFVERFGLENKLVLLTVSRLSERKGHAVVLKAVKIVKETIPNIKYLIVGTGPYENNLKIMAKDLNLESETIFVGYVGKDDMVDMYNLCDLFIMPNREVVETTDSIEGFGIVFLEASSCGKTVIAGKSGGTSEAVLEGISGFLVDPDDEVALAEKIINLLSNPSMRKEIGEKGRAWVKDTFSWEKSALQVMPFV